MGFLRLPNRDEPAISRICVGDVARMPAPYGVDANIGRTAVVDRSYFAAPSPFPESSRLFRSHRVSRVESTCRSDGWSAHQSKVGHGPATVASLRRTTVQSLTMSWDCHGCELEVACEFCESCSEHCVARLPNEIDAHCAYLGRMLAHSTVVARPALPPPTGATSVAPATSATFAAGCRALAPLF